MYVYGGKKNHLTIQCSLNIVGSPDVLDKSNIIVVGGFTIDRFINGNDTIN